MFGIFERFVQCNAFKAFQDICRQVRNFDKLVNNSEEKHLKVIKIINKVKDTDKKVIRG